MVLANLFLCVGRVLGRGGCPKRMSLDGNERCRVDGGQLVMRIPQTHGLGGEGYVFVGLKHFSA